MALLLGPGFLAVMAFYYVVTTAYSFDLKRRLVVDICTLAGLYTLRIIAGGVATGIPLSVWLLAFSIFFFFALAAMKRQAELVSGAAAGEEKAHGRGYQVDRPADRGQHGDRLGLRLGPRHGALAQLARGAGASTTRPRRSGASASSCSTGSAAW